MQFDSQIVGRSEERDRLSSVLDGRSSERLILVIGDAGIGKSRLMWESTTASQAAGVTVITGACLPLTESLPLLPITEALRELSRHDGGRVFSESLDRAPAYVTPEIAGLLPELEDTQGTMNRTRTKSGAAGRRFAAVRELLTIVAGHAPLALVVEDLHWADRTALDLLTYLVDGGRGGPFAIAVTCRSDEPGMSAATRDWLNAMGAVPGVTELRLKPLSRAESHELVTSLVADRGTPDLDGLYERAGGNPFFTEQLVAAGDRATIPMSLAAMLTGRTRATSELGPARARGPRGCRPPRRRRPADRREHARRPRPWVMALEELFEADLVGSDIRGWHRPRHALLAEAVTEDLQPVRRQALHARFAEALSPDDDPSTAAEVAAHWAGAGRPDQEIMSTVRAARVRRGRCSRSPRPDSHWRRVIELSDAGAQLPPRAASGAGVRPRDRRRPTRWESFQEASDLTEQAVSRFADGRETPSDVAVLLAGASIYGWLDSLDSALDGGA